MPATVAVLGSCIMDMIMYTKSFPRPGETVLGKSFQSGCGGKGANQAVAAAKLGAAVALIGKVGDDIVGRSYMEELRQTTVNLDHVTTVREGTTGVAAISVDDAGENKIAICPGANLQLSADDLRAAASVIQAAAILVCQCEVAMDVTRDALILARQNGVTTLMNAAPAIDDIDPEIIKNSDIFCVNEIEGHTYTGKVINTPEDALSVCQTLVKEKKCGTAIVTIGVQGVVYYTHDGQSGHIPALVVTAVDSTGAGDAFVRALAYYHTCHQDLPLPEVLRRCCVVASLSVQAHGTQCSFPSREQLPADIFS